MKRLPVCFALVLTASLLVAGQEVPAKQKDGAGKNKKAPEVSGVVRFLPAPIVLTGASGEVHAAAISPDGKRVANVGGTYNPPAGYLAVVDIETKKEVFELHLAQPGLCVSYSPDGKHLVYSGRDGTVRVLRTDTWEPAFALKLVSPARVCFAPDGKTIATATDSKLVQIWDVPSGEERAKLRGAAARLMCVAFSPDGKRLAAGGVEATPQRVGRTFVWDVATERLVTTVEVPDTPTFAVAFTPDSALLTTGGPDGQVRQWELPGGKPKSAWRTKASVFSLAYSGSGLIAVGSDTGPIALLNAGSGEEVGRLAGHTGQTRALAFTDGGKRLVSGGANRSLKVWNVPDRKEVATLRQDEAPRDLPAPLAVAATTDGSLVAVATEDGVILRDGRNGEHRGRLAGHEDAVTCVAFSPDGKTLASGSADKTVKLWDAGAGKERHTLKGHTNWVYAIAFSPDGKTVATGAYDKTVRLWDVATGKETASVEAHRGSVRALAFSPDGKALATGGSDRAVKVWDAATRELRHTLKGHTGSVRAVAFSPDGKALASGSEDNTVRLWDPVTGKDLFPLKGHADEVTSVLFADPQTVVSGSADGTFRVWEATTGASAATVQAHQGGLTGLAALANGTGLVSSGQDKLLKRWRTDAPGPVRLFAGHTGVVHAANFSHDGRRIVSCGNWPEGDKTVRIWDTATGRELVKVTQSSQLPMAVFSPDGKHVLVASDDHNAYLFDAETGAEVRKYEGHTGGVMSVAFSADGGRVLTSSGDKTVRVWDAETGKQLKRMEGHTDVVRRAVFHPDGKHVLSGGRDGLVRMWSLETEKEVRQFPSSGNWADCLAVSSDGRFVAVGAKVTKVYEVESGKLIHEFEGHSFGATTVEYSPDGKYLLTGGYDGAAKMWDAGTGKEVYRFRGHREFLWSATFSRDGKWILTAGGGSGGGGKYQKGTDHAIRLWAMPDAQLMAEFAPAN